MPKKSTMDRAKKAKRQGKSPSTQASEFVHEEIEDIRKGKHGARSAKQAIAIACQRLAGQVWILSLRKRELLRKKHGNQQKMRTRKPAS
jgi:hypothetical protein